MSKDLQAGMVWIRLINRIADQRAERRKTPKPKGQPTTPPADNLMPQDVPVGSPPEAGPSVLFPTTASIEMSIPFGTSVKLKKLEKIRGWREADESSSYVRLGDPLPKTQFTFDP